MDSIEKIKKIIAEFCKKEFSEEINESNFNISLTNPNFKSTGDYSFNFLGIKKFTRLSPQQIGEKIMDITSSAVKSVDADFLWVNTEQVAKGFINIKFSSNFWLKQLKEISENKAYGTFATNHKKVLLEYCGPNTNKPLHIGHVRNMLLGFSMSEILTAAGYDVTKVNIYNDRGINISKSMVSYKRHVEKLKEEQYEKANLLCRIGLYLIDLIGCYKEPTPKSTGIKGDHFVGDWYVRFNTVSSQERIDFYNSVNACIDSIVADNSEARLHIINRVTGLKEILDTLSGKIPDENFKDNPDAFLRTKLLLLKNIKAQIVDPKEPDVVKCVSCIDYLENTIQNFLNSSIFSEAVSMVQKWEEGDRDTMRLWKKMNAWVYEGFHETFNMIGVDFEKDYYESETYLLGKDIVDEGLQKGVFQKRADGAVIVDLTPDGLDEKVLLRSDGTSVYITQDLATAQLRHQDFNMEKMIYVVANEQDYHFKVLKLALQKLGKQWADGIYHLSYALVESPTGRFKSREGKTADADDLISEVLRIAEEKTKELGKIEGFTEEEANTLYKTIGLGALKYFVLRVNPYKKIIFNPEESIDFHGHTGPFVQYTHARIKAIMRKAGNSDFPGFENLESLADVERELIIHLTQYEATVTGAAEKYDPSEIANYVYALSKLYNKFYHEQPILNAATAEEKNFRIALSDQTGIVIKKAMRLLGIEVPEKM